MEESGGSSSVGNTVEESSGASPIGGTGEESGGASTENGSEEESRGVSSENRRGNKRVKLKRRKDRISSLPDSVIQRILSFLPSTKEAIQTGVLSKRWRNQWTRIPFLIFDSSGIYYLNSDEDYVRISDEYFARSIGNALLLHGCSKIKKLHLNYNFEKDTHFSSKIRFAIRKNVEELILICYRPEAEDPYLLPKFLCDNSSIVKLELFNCYFSPDWRINWGSLKALKMNGENLPFGASIEIVLSGCPSLESLELKSFIEHWMDEDNVVIASNSLKVLIFVHVCIRKIHIEISCPNLEEFSVKALYACMFPSVLPDKTIEKVLASSPLLHSLELIDCHFNQLVIASKSVKNIVLGQLINEKCAIGISCPNLEVLNLYDLDTKAFKLMNFPSSLCAIVELETVPFMGCGENGAKLILEQLQHVKELRIGSRFIEILSALEMRGLSYPLLNNKSLTLNGLNFEHLPGIACALRTSPALERLIIKLQLYQRRYPLSLNAIGDGDFEKNYWKSNGTALNCLVSHLKIVEILASLREMITLIVCSILLSLF